MALKTKIFDAADYLTDPETISAYITESLEGNDPRDIAHALNDVARARGGLAHLATETGMSAEELQSVLSDGENLDSATLLKIIHALGVRLSASIAA